MAKVNHTKRFIVGDLLHRHNTSMVGILHEIWRCHNGFLAEGLTPKERAFIQERRKNIEAEIRLLSKVNRRIQQTAKVNHG